MIRKLMAIDELDVKSMDVDIETGVMTVQEKPIEEDYIDGTTVLRLPTNQQMVYIIKTENSYRLIQHRRNHG